MRKISELRKAATCLRAVALKATLKWFDMSLLSIHIVCRCFKLLSIRFISNTLMFCTWSDTSVYFVMLYESEEIASPEFWHSIVFSCVKTVKFVQLQKQIQHVSLGALPTVPGCSWICL